MNEESIVMGNEIAPDLYRGTVEGNPVTIIYSNQTPDDVALRLEQLTMCDSPLIPDIIAVIPSQDENDEDRDMVLCEGMVEPVLHRTNWVYG